MRRTSDPILSSQDLGNDTYWGESGGFGNNSGGGGSGGMIPHSHSDPIVRPTSLYATSTTVSDDSTPPASTANGGGGGGGGSSTGSTSGGSTGGGSGSGGAKPNVHVDTTDVNSAALCIRVLQQHYQRQKATTTQQPRSAYTDANIGERLYQKGPARSSSAPLGPYSNPDRGFDSPKANNNNDAYDEDVHFPRDNSDDFGPPESRKITASRSDPSLFSLRMLHESDDTPDQHQRAPDPPQFARLSSSGSPSPKIEFQLQPGFIGGSSGGGGILGQIGQPLIETNTNNTENTSTSSTSTSTSGVSASPSPCSSSVGGPAPKGVFGRERSSSGTCSRDHSVGNMSSPGIEFSLLGGASGAGGMMGGTTPVGNPTGKSTGGSGLGGLFSPSSLTPVSATTPSGASSNNTEIPFASIAPLPSISTTLTSRSSATSHGHAPSSASTSAQAYTQSPPFGPASLLPSSMADLVSNSSATNSGHATPTAFNATTNMMMGGLADKTNALSLADLYQQQQQQLQIQQEQIRQQQEQLQQQQLLLQQQRQLLMQAQQQHAAQQQQFINSGINSGGGAPQSSMMQSQQPLPSPSSTSSNSGAGSHHQNMYHNNPSGFPPQQQQQQHISVFAPVAGAGGSGMTPSSSQQFMRGSGVQSPPRDPAIDQFQYPHPPPPPSLPTMAQPTLQHQQQQLQHHQHHQQPFSQQPMQQQQQFSHHQQIPNPHTAQQQQQQHQPPLHQQIQQLQQLQQQQQQGSLMPSHLPQQQQQQQLQQQFRGGGGGGGPSMNAGAGGLGIFTPPSPARNDPAPPSPFPALSGQAGNHQQHAANLGLPPTDAGAFVKSPPRGGRMAGGGGGGGGLDGLGAGGKSFDKQDSGYMPPSILAKHVLALLKDKTFDVPEDYSVGWMVLNKMWNVNPGNVDEAALADLATLPPRQQAAVLLSLATIDLRAVDNISAFLSCLIKKHETGRQICIYFLLGQCPGDGSGSGLHQCPSVHPINTKGWDLLRDRWSVTYKEMDYAVLNYLASKSAREREFILMKLADTNIRHIKNISAFLARIIRDYESRTGSASAGGPGGLPGVPSGLGPPGPGTISVGPPSGIPSSPSTSSATSLPSSFMATGGLPPQQQGAVNTNNTTGFSLSAVVPPRGGGGLGVGGAGLLRR